MSKERLEEIHENARHNDVDGDWRVTLPKKDYYFLREQAERVQELEEENHLYKLRKENAKELNNVVIKPLTEQNKRYREAFDLIKKTANDYKEGHLLDIQDSYFVDEIIAIMDNKSLEGDPDS